MSITVLKYNVPWGPFTARQIHEGLERGDFTLKYLAHAPGMNEWHPLGEVLDHVERTTVPRLPDLPPLPPEDCDLPPIPGTSVPPPKPQAPPARIEPAPVAVRAEPPPLPFAEEKALEVNLEPAPFLRRAVAFIVDCAILFVPLGLFYIAGALLIEIPDAWHKVSHQVRMDQWEFLTLTTHRLFWLDALGFGWLYGAGFEASRAQATIGKRWMGLIVTDLRGERIGFVRATGRYAAKYLSALPCFLGFIMALFGARHLALHDRLSDTRVVRR